MENNIPTNPTPNITQPIPQQPVIEPNNLPTPPAQITENTESKKFKLKHLILLFFLGIFTFSFIGYYFLALAPSAEAKEYLRDSSEKFGYVMRKAHFFSDKFTKSIEKTRETFNEITTSVDYDQSKIDTQEDIEDINKALKLISEAKKRKEKLKIPQELKPFNDKLDTYYKNTEEVLSLMLIHQKLQMAMLNAYGDELSIETKKANTIIKSPKSVEELTNFLDNISSLSAQSVERFKALAPVPEEERSFYDIKLLEVEDLATTLSSASSQLKLGTGFAGKNSAMLILGLSERMIERDKLLSKISQDYVNNSKVSTLFKENEILEKEIISDFQTLGEKYDIKTQITPMPSITSTPEASPSARLTPEPTIYQEITGTPSAEKLNP
jgi:hypothetical protein